MSVKHTGPRDAASTEELASTDADSPPSAHIATVMNMMPLGTRDGASTEELASPGFAAARVPAAAASIEDRRPEKHAGASGMARACAHICCSTGP